MHNNETHIKVDKWSKRCMVSWEQTNLVHSSSIFSYDSNKFNRRETLVNDGE